MSRAKTIAITRSQEDAAEFIDLARRNNANPVPLPTIELVSKGEKIVDEFLESAKTYDPDYTVFMSSKAVRLLFDVARESSKLESLQLAVANTIVIAVGPKTSAALEQEGIKVNGMPKKTFSSVGVGELFTGLGAVGKKVLVPRSGASTPFLKDLLSKIGLDVMELHLYDVCTFRDTSQWNGFRAMFARGEVDGMVFTSASSVRGFFDIMSRDHAREDVLDLLSRTHVVAIGPFTADELAKFHVTSKVSQTHTVAGSFEAVWSAISS